MSYFHVCTLPYLYAHKEVTHIQKPSFVYAQNLYMHIYMEITHMQKRKWIYEGWLLNMCDYVVPCDAHVSEWCLSEDGNARIWMSSHIKQSKKNG